MTIHWCGTGLSSGPGLRRLIQDGQDVTVWNRPLEAARQAVGDLTDRIRLYDPDALAAAFATGDIVVSMLPSHMHADLARLAVAAGAHFICSSYADADLRALDAAARDAGSVVTTEVGLDPGLDHLMAHWLVADYRASRAYDARNDLSFHSHCGGLARHPNAFRYKFSWSPLGVLKALKAPSRSIRDFSELSVRHPWDALTTYRAPLPRPETFEVYPNRDSLPYLAEYRFDPEWRVREFVRGTLRLSGWAQAWSSVFDQLDTLDDAGLQALSDRLWSENPLEPGEADRVVLAVSLKAENQGIATYHKTWLLDAEGDVRGSAMARLVSGTMRLAVLATQERALPAGVHTAPSDPRLVARWLDAMGHEAQYMRLLDHLA